MTQGVLLAAKAERLDRAAKFAGEVFGLPYEDEIKPAPRAGYGTGRIWAGAIALMACGYVFLM
ncbi:MAG: hypothetical protein ACRCWO_06390 [Bosea sp. (in: a-proteobacteria)]